MSLLKEPFATLADQLEMKNAGRAVNLFADGRDDGYGDHAGQQIAIPKESSKTKVKSGTELATAHCYAARPLLRSLPDAAILRLFDVSMEEMILFEVNNP